MTSRIKGCGAVSVLLLSVCFSGAARGDWMSGRELVEMCKPEMTDVVYRLKVSECSGYVVGIADTFDCHAKVLGLNWNSAANVPQAKLVETVISWLARHPEALTYEADGVVAAALAEHFPCH